VEHERFLAGERRSGRRRFARVRSTEEARDPGDDVGVARMIGGDALGDEETTELVARRLELVAGDPEVPGSIRSRRRCARVPSARASSRGSAPSVATGGAVRANGGRSGSGR
jgi:hypothetical protein